jgi:hypothetical protein
MQSMEQNASSSLHERELTGDASGNLSNGRSFLVAMGIVKTEGQDYVYALKAGNHLAKNVKGYPTISRRDIPPVPLLWVSSSRLFRTAIFTHPKSAEGSSQINE